MISDIADSVQKIGCVDSSTVHAVGHIGYVKLIPLVDHCGKGLHGVVGIGFVIAAHAAGVVIHNRNDFLAAKGLRVYGKRKRKQYDDCQKDD